MKKGFKNYLIGWLLLTLLIIVINIVLGLALGLLNVDLVSTGNMLLSLFVFIISLAIVSTYKDLSFWKLFGFTFLADIVLTIILVLLVMVVL